MHTRGYGVLTHGHLSTHWIPLVLEAWGRLHVRKLARDFKPYDWRLDAESTDTALVKTGVPHICLGRGLRFAGFPLAAAMFE